MAVQSIRHPQSRAVRSEQGSALIEVLIGLVIFALVVIIALQLLAARTTAVYLTMRQRAAEEASETGLEALRRLSSTEVVADTGTFTLNPDGVTITITGACTSQLCDRIPDADSSPSYTRSILGGGDWNGVNNSGVTSTLLIRRWRVDTVDAALRLRRLTLVVLTNETSLKPLAVKTVEVSGLQ